MTALDEAWALLTSDSPVSQRSDAFRSWLQGAPDALEIALGCAERLASAAPDLRAAFGTMLALQVAARTPAEAPLDPRIDAVVGLVPRWRGQQDLVYRRIPTARLAAILARMFAERPRRDDDAAAHDMIAALHHVPDATPAFVAYLRARKQLRRVKPGGDLAASFERAIAAVPRIAALAALPQAKPERAPALGPFEIVKIAEVSSPAEVKALGAKHAAQFLAATALAAGKTKLASVQAAFARPLRDGESHLVAQLHEVRDGAARYDLWVLFADTGVLFTAGTTKRLGVAWIQGSFEASLPAHAPLAQALAAAPWR